MTDQTPRDPAVTATIDQLLADFSRRLDGWVIAMRDQASKHGPDQALANVMLAMNLEPIPPDDMKALFVIALQRLATQPSAPEDPGKPAPRGHQFTDGWAQGRKHTAEELLGRLKQIEQPDRHWPAGDAVSIVTEWFTGMGIDIGGPGPYSCTECGHIDQPEYWHMTTGHAGHTQPDDEEAGDLEGDGEGYDTSSLAKEDERNAWQHTIVPDAELPPEPEDGADYTIDKP